MTKKHVLVLVLAYDKIIAIDIYLNVNIETKLLISGDKKIKLFVIPVKEVKLVRPLNTFFYDPIFTHVVPFDLN